QAARRLRPPLVQQALSGEDRPHFTDGSATRPMNRIIPLALSRMKNRNGWSALNSTGGARAAAARAITAAVAAAASVPFSSTLTNALWKTSLRNRRSRGLGGLAIAVKSAWAGEKASVIPRPASASPSPSEPGGSTSNFGRLTCTRVGASD